MTQSTLPPIKDLTIAYLLWFLFGFFGIHKFYLNRIAMGIFYMFTCGGFFIGWFFDLFTMRSQVDKANFAFINQVVQNQGTFQYPSTSNVQKGKYTIKQKEKDILLIARKHKGKVTPTEVAMDSSLSIEEAQKILNSMIDRGHARLEVSESGMVFYQFDSLTNNKDY